MLKKATVCFISLNETYLTVVTTGLVMTLSLNYFDFFLPGFLSF